MEKNMLTLQELYKFICEKEGITKKSLRFGRVGKGGAVCNYIGKKVVPIWITARSLDEV